MTRGFREASGLRLGNIIKVVVGSMIKAADEGEGGLKASDISALYSHFFPNDYLRAVVQRLGGGGKTISRVPSSLRRGTRQWSS